MKKMDGRIGHLGALLVVLGATCLAACGGGSGTPAGDDGGTIPASAQELRGGLLYDKWWAINGEVEPVATHPAYPAPPGTQTGSATWRCKECHGWDYRGKDGAYGSGSHYSGLDGILGAAANTPNSLFNQIQSGPGGHDFGTMAPLSDADVWDLVAFIKREMIDMTPHINSDKSVNGNAANGSPLYAANCSVCHGADGKTIDFGGGEGVGDIANGNPWETLHKIRFGHPGSAMPSMIQAGLSLTQQVDILAHAQTLPVVP